MYGDAIFDPGLKAETQPERPCRREGPNGSNLSQSSGRAAVPLPSEEERLREKRCAARCMPASSASADESRSVESPVRRKGAFSFPVSR
ncbi:hypothetical protein HMPREF0762_01884 [Slackia exigua ATCC 700122]|uniref:Uncharacterized protein n=1 Tax=Slackia exigua (strain ATCC 700122 / DSM 15923 / CIP 105133 / JCM 11022 / KCTC 5966 / S-7) TaxID=649764 RepID=D0WJ59_SLAES|nr:hypothetical protein HMPREF0762_01884 [Slackia exigua ATCC 700122]